MTIQAVLPGEKTASMLPFERWNDPLLGTDFSYEDMVESQFFWKNQGLLAPEKYGARECFVLKSTAGSQDRTYYDSVTSWIDRNILYPVHVVKTFAGRGSRRNSFTTGCGRSAVSGPRCKPRQSCWASLVPRFLQSNGARQRQTSDAKTLISASPALKRSK